MKTNIIAKYTNMKKYMKYLCAFLLIMGTSVHAWATTETMDFSQCWGMGSSGYESGVYTYGGYAIEAHDAKYNTYSNYIQLNYLSGGDHNAWGGIILPPFSGTVSSIRVTAPSGIGTDNRYIDLYVNGVYQARSSAIQASGSYTFTSLSIAAGSTIELRNSTANNEFHIASIVVTHNGSQMGTSGSAPHGKISPSADGNGTITIATNPIANGASTTLTATPASGWTFNYWEIKSVQGKCQNWQYYQNEFTSGNVSPNNTGSATVTLTNNAYADEFIAIAHFVETTCTKTPTITFATSGTIEKKVGAAIFTNAATVKFSGSATGQTITYSSSNESIAYVDDATGEVLVADNAVGSATITASVVESGDYCAQSASYTINVTGYNVTYHYPSSCSASTPANATNVFGSHSLPTNMGVDGYQFVGWTTNSSFTDGDAAPTPLYTTSVTVSSNIDLYAVYKKASSKFLKMAANTALTTGDYVICTNYVGTATVMTNTLDGSKRMTTNSSDYTFDGDGNLSCNDEECIWTISGSAGNWILYNSSSKKYLSANNEATGSSDRQMRLADASSTNFEKWIIAQKDASTVPYQVRNKGRVASNASDNGLGVSSGKIGYYASTGSLYFFKRTSTANAYTINPSCTAAEYTVTFNLSSAPTGAAVSASATGATFSSPVLSPVTSGTAVTIGATAPTGYHFDHWTATGGASLSSAATSASNGFTMPASNVVLTPVYAADSYTINYLDKGGSAFSGTHDTGYPTTHTYGTETTLSGATKSGWEFAGWYTTSACTSGTQVTTLGATDYTSSPTLYALWVHFTDPLAWCPEPEVHLTGDVYVTSTQGKMITAVAQLTLNARNLAISGVVRLTTPSGSGVSFSTSRVKYNATSTTLDVTADSGGDITDQTIYVHYSPTAAGTGAPADITVRAEYQTNTSYYSTCAVHVRNMPSTFAIAAKVGSTWYALPANMSSAGNPEGILLEVNESNWTAKGPSTLAYELWPVKTTTGGADLYSVQGEKLRFAGNSHKGLYGSTSTNTVNNNAVIDAIDDDPGVGAQGSYEWAVTTTVVGSTWKYVLEAGTDKDLVLHKGDKLLWGTYGDYATREIYLLPLTEITPFTTKVVEWYPTKVLVYSPNNLKTIGPTVSINGTPVVSPTFTGKGNNLYEIGNLPLESNPAKTLTLSYTAAAVDYATSITIPIIISRVAKSVVDPEGALVAGLRPLNEPFASLTTDVCNYTDLVVRDGAILTLNGTKAQNSFFDVTIYPTSKISVPETNANAQNNYLGVHSLTFFGGIDEIYDGSSYTINKYGVPELSLKGKCDHKTVTTINYDMRVDDSQMYSITVPYDVNLADITWWDGTSMGTLGDKLWVSAYDGQARANKDMAHTWIWEVNFVSKGLEAKLKQGTGYTISADKQSGFGDGEGGGYSIIRLPMRSNFSGTAPNNVEAAKTVQVTAYVNTQGVTVGDNNKGWNLVGNPYMVSISGGEPGSQLVVGKLVESGTGPWDWDGTTYPYRYVTIPNDNGTDYYQMKFKDATLKPFKNFFVQIDNTTEGNALGFALASRQNAPARYLQVQDREVEFEIVLSNDARQDNLGLLIAEQYSPAYEINADLEKMESSMSVYTIYGGYKLAYNALSPDDAASAIPVGYIANASGSYIFQLDDNSDVSDVEHIWLIDYETSATTDLLLDVYEFTTPAGRNDARFALMVELKKQKDITTDIIDVNKDSQEPAKFIYRDKMYILRGGKIYDATGKQVREINK